MKKGELTFFCGKMGAGKSSKAHEIAQVRKAVLLSEDEWLESLYPKKISSLEDYIHFSGLLKPPIKKLVQAILATGTDVIMDFPANTIAQRQWFKSIFVEIQAPHRLIYIDMPDEVCLEQISKRRVEQPSRATTDTAQMFEQVTKHFVAPTFNEGFEITILAKNT